MWGGDRGKYIPLFPPSSSKTSVKVQSEKGRTMNVPSPFLSSFMVKSGFLFYATILRCPVYCRYLTFDVEFFCHSKSKYICSPFKTLSKYLKGPEERKGDGYTFRNLDHNFEVKNKANRLPGSCGTFEVKNKANRLPESCKTCLGH